MRTITLAWLALVAAPPLHAQEAADVLAGLRNAGGWVAIPIEGGVGSVSTVTMPAMGLRVEGCVTVWPGHSGEFEIRAHDSVSDSSLVATARPGEGIRFAHTFGMQAQVDFDFTWSAQRDTTLLLWIGLAIGQTTEEACEPVYGGGE